MKKINFQLLMTISMCFFSSVSAQDATTAAPKTTAASECTKELLLSYFPENFVKETLKKFDVPQDKWDSIANALTEKNKDVVKLVEEKAAQQTPNPLKDPALHQQAVAIFRDTLMQVFSDVLKANGVTDDNQIKQMFIDVQQQKAKRFVECRKQAEATAAGTPNAAPVKDNDDDSDDDDDDDDFDDKEPEKDGADEEDADNSVKFPKPKGPGRYPVNRDESSMRDQAMQQPQQQWQGRPDQQQSQWERQGDQGDQFYQQYPR